MPSNKFLRQLETALGDLDLLRSIGKDLTYSDLLARTHEYEVGEIRVLVLDLETVIETKQHTDRDKDRAMLPVLLRTLELKRATPGPGGG